MDPAHSYVDAGAQLGLSAIVPVPRVAVALL